MNWEQTITIIGVNAAIVGLLAGWITWVINRVDTDVKGISNKLDSVSNRMDQRFESQSARTDKLYEMFVNLLKEVRK